ncbi:MAG TPA: hypothetical protein VH333_16855 [Pseudonocardiaceae bacterium]|nr:hypothetical protein [Pseudonocardiaceae bacterium]
MPVVESGPDHAGGAIKLTVVLDRRSTDTHFVAAFLRVDFANPEVTASELQITGPSEQDGWHGSMPISVSVLRGGVYGWLLGDPLGSAPIPREFTAHTLLSVPASGRAVATLAVTARLDATLLQVGRWWRPAHRSHACCRAPAEFAVPLPDAGPSVPTDAWTATVPAHRGGTVRLCLAADMERFSRFRVPEAVRAQQRFVDVLADARRYAEIPEAAVDLQESGDGQFAVLPPGLDESTVVPRLIDGLRIALAHANSDLSPHARLRLRVALHRGHIAPGANGWVGESSIAIHRILDSEAVRTALATNESADFALIVSEVLYREVVCQRYAWLDPDEFAKVEVRLPAKGFAAPAWIYLPRR